ncbi:hypothetical protein P170DRAFT_241909 [Aspergillus steynii IBT 23096]|uniref:Uncharacterized protein n=1 Tax=Aspergillus steynii IBT 23096 TaxID=1392250 RepID=A0A2I2FXJ7_9EURO|nr:uncharacterized protein P170DRAFT_241909 [Aspergillus steynii IBT 23096]PLB45364.1 hypothetical protein P170DRAFT_241909 [Aspergillus steynii IBT 23096]
MPLHVSFFLSVFYFFTPCSFVAGLFVLSNKGLVDLESNASETYGDKGTCMQPPPLLRIKYLKQMLFAEVPNSYLATFGCRVYR